MNNISTLLIIAIASWIVLPSIAALIAFFSVSLATVGYAAAAITALSLCFEGSRDWLLDLMV